MTKAREAVLEHLAEREELLAWAREEAETFLLAHGLTVAGAVVDLLAAKIAASYLVGANAALLDETARITQARSRPARSPTLLSGDGEASPQSESDATGFSGTEEPRR